LYESDDDEFPNDFNDHQRLEMFQSVAISGRLEECLAASYFGKSLSKKQLSILEVIYNLTAKWLVGKLSQTLLDRLDLLSGLSDKGKDITDMTGKIMELIGATTNGDGKKVKSTKAAIYTLTGEKIAEEEKQTA